MFTSFARAFVVAASLFTVASASAETFRAPAGQHWVVIFSTRDKDLAIGIAHNYGDTARVVRSRDGAFSAVLTPRPGLLLEISRDPELGWLPLPIGTQLSDGSSFEATVWSAAPARPDSELTEEAPVHLASGDFKVEVVRSPIGDTGWTAHITGSAGDHQLFALDQRFEDGSGFPGTVRLAELDPGNTHPEVMVEAYTGGAHCCTDIAIATETAPGQWAMVPFGDGDNTPAVEDIDGDGASELVIGDDSFLYTFASYAESMSPIRIKRLRGDRIEDVTTNPAFRSRLVQEVRGSEFAARQVPKLWMSNGFLAAWVASKTLIGEGDDAWKRMLTLYNATSSFGVTVCTINKPMESCPIGRRKQLPFPEGLIRHLVDNGYPLPAAARKH